MSGQVKFDWQVEDSGQDPEQAPAPQRPFSRLGLLLLLLLLLVTTIGGIGAYQRIEANRDNIRQQTQALYAATASAYAARDGDLFFSLFTPDPAYRAAQLHPQQQAFWETPPQVAFAEQHGNEVWVTLSWEDPTTPGQLYQRAAFLDWNGFALRHMPPASATFWGPEERRQTAWGELVYTTADGAFVNEIEATVSQTLPALCGGTCPEMTLELVPDMALRSANGRLAVPSPQLIGIDADGQPAPSFWFELATRLNSFVKPQPIRYAVQGSQVSTYQNLADAYQLRFPERQVEIVSLNDLEGEADAVLAQVDGALLTPPVARFIAVDLKTFPPTRELFASGQVLDVTTLALSDPAFAPGDFYEQVWQGGWWRGRMWLVPHAAAASLIYYDRALYDALGEPYPSSGFGWESFTAEAASFQIAGLSDWGFVDGGNQLLYAHLFQQVNRCGEVAVRCRAELSAVDVAATYSWYAAAVEQQVTPFQPGMSAREWLNQGYTLISPTQPQAALWLGEPVDYENHQVQRNASVVGLPGCEGECGVMPLRVYGSVISSQSQRPLETWHWITFLSYQYTERITRFVPARPSVAKLSGYWDNLPPDLGAEIRRAWPNARPILITELDYFTPTQIDAVLTGAVSPQEAIHLRPRVEWFLPTDLDQ